MTSPPNNTEHHQSNLTEFVKIYLVISMSPVPDREIINSDVCGILALVFFV